MYVLTVVSTDSSSSAMSVSNMSATNYRDAVEKKQQIIDDAVASGEWEVMSDYEPATWLHNVRFPERLCFMQITTCFPLKLHYNQ